MKLPSVDTVRVVQVCQNHEHDRLRSILFGVGDCLFLMLAGAAATLATHLVHRVDWGFAITCLAGMSAAMAVQALLAISVAPILGSIEAMTPSMVVAMASSMSECALHVIKRELSWPGSCGLGAAVGACTFVFVVAYGAACKRSLRRAYPRG